MSRDLRKYTNQTTIRLIIGGILILFLIGDGLIYLLYGSRAAIGGVICLGVGLLPIILIGLILLIIDLVLRWLDKRDYRDG